MQGNQKQTHWSYIAGIMDADGCFMIMRQKRGRKSLEKGEFNLSHMAGLKIAMIEIEAISFITHEMGFGHYDLNGARKNRKNSKPIYHWYLRQRQRVMEFLENVIPFLRVKKKRAEFLFEFVQRMEKYTDKRSCKRLTKTELDYREKTYWKMREFNGNKVAATTKS
jgi:hypothetical protein